MHDDMKKLFVENEIATLEYIDGVGFGLSVRDITQTGYCGNVERIKSKLDEMAIEYDARKIHPLADDVFIIVSAKENATNDG